MSLPEWEEDAGNPVRVGLVGCGVISARYLENCARLPNLRVVACADLDPARAEARAAEYSVPRACSPQELLSDPDVEVVLNLTVPLAHAEISLQALDAGKHVYSEKPLALDREAGRRILDAADLKGLLVGCAPDTFLGAGWQACRKAIDLGAMGRPVAATAFFMSHGMEGWHPQPDFFYGPSGGPLLDIGPYGLTALAALIGPIRRVTAMAQTAFSQRTIGNGPRRGQSIPVGVPTMVASVLQLEPDILATHTVTWDVWHHHAPEFEIHGSEGSLGAGDPNTFDGRPQLRRSTWPDWHDIMTDSPLSGNWRGIGLTDMARAIRHGGTFRATGRLAYHVLDVMCAIREATEQGRAIEIESTAERPAPLPVGIGLPSAVAAGIEDSWLETFT